MRKFKLTKQEIMPHDITNKYDFEELTGGAEPFVVREKSGATKAFGICPACDNPIQILGLYKPIGDGSTAPYGRHYNRDAKIAKHNENTYLYCPYASRIYEGNTEHELKSIMTEVEAKIYYLIRANFDSVVYLMRQISGLYISSDMAKEMLNHYVESQGYMYYGATYYNIPWMILHTATLPAIPLFGKIVRKDSILWNICTQLENVDLLQKNNKSSYAIIKGKSKNGKPVFIDYAFSFNKHKRMVKDETVKEELSVTISSKNRVSTNNPAGLVPLKNNTLIINENRFPSLLQSDKAKELRNTEENQELLAIAKECMPDLDGFPDMYNTDMIQE